MLKTLSRLALAAAVVIGSSLSASQPAEAGRGGRIAAGIIAGVVAGSILGSYAYARPRYVYGYTGYSYGGYDAPRCYPGPKQCGYSRHRCGYDRFGDYFCTGGEWRCWRPTICD